jgi:hypothetical protein
MGLRIGWRFKKLKLKIAGKRKTPTMTDTEKKAIDIALALINNSDSELSVAPITKRAYIQNGEMFIIIDYKRLTIINGIYHYDINLTEKQEQYIMSRFNKKIDRKLLKIENHIKSKVNKSLDMIYEHVHKLADDGEDND